VTLLLGGVLIKTEGMCTLRILVFLNVAVLLGDFFLKIEMFSTLRIQGFWDVMLCH
jgi:hypothetical protein